MKRIVMVLAVAFVMAAMMVAMALPVFAAITTQCENPAGNVSNGCQGGGPSQDYVARNPAGHAPLGQQP